MTIGTLIFALLFMAGLFISVFFVEFGIVAIIGILFAVPVIMFLFLLMMRRNVSVSVDAKNPVAEKDAMDRPARAVITLSVDNNSRILPVTKGVAKVRYENRFSGDRGKLKIRFSVDAKRRRDRRIPVVMWNCGNVAIKVEKVRVYDYLNIFAWTVGKKFDTQNVLVLPPLREMYMEKDRWYNETTEDSDRFSLYKKGDDPSEIFDIREFADGDKIQRIHWKLSRKTGNLMVKEGSLPLSKAVNIFIDLSVNGTKPEERHPDANKLVQGIYSVAMFMTERGIPQNYIWYDEDNEVVQERLVEHEEELLWMFQDLFACRMSGQPEALAAAYLEWDGGRPLEAALYLTVSDHAGLSGSGLVRGRLEVMDLRE